MKDYYDLFKLCGSDSMQDAILSESIKVTFAQRKTEIFNKLEFDGEDLNQLQTNWAAFVKKMRLNDAPENISKVIDVVNKKLKQVLL